MLLQDDHEQNLLTVRVTGYQFPDAQELRQRFSWHMVGGEARCERGSWRFHWQALTCDEAPWVSAWLTGVAEAVHAATPLPASPRFLEPNLAFRALPADSDSVRIVVSFDLEFQPPWHRRCVAGDPFTLSFTMTAGQLRRAARQWDAERAMVPGHLRPAAGADSELIWRQVTASDAALLAAAVTGDWEGAGELRSQLPGLTARPACSCGCGSIELRPRQGEPALTTPSPAPREGIVLDVTGEVAGGLLLFLRHGLLQSLEVYSYGDPLPMPALSRVQWAIAGQ